MMLMLSAERRAEQEWDDAADSEDERSARAE